MLAVCSRANLLLLLSYLPKSRLVIESSATIENLCTIFNLIFLRFNLIAFDSTLPKHNCITRNNYWIVKTYEQFTNKPK